MQNRRSVCKSAKPHSHVPNSGGLSLGRTMTLDYKVRFASKVMLVQEERNMNNALNRQRLSEEFESQHSPYQRL